jgi:dynein heavy chain
MCGVPAGARWDRAKRCLVEPEPGTLHTRMPLLWLRATDSPAVPQLAHQLALPGATVPTLVNGSYVCPIFKYVSEFGAKHNLADEDDCLLAVLLPPGARRAEHWAIHNVGMIAMADPDSVLEQQPGWLTARLVATAGPR